LRRLSGGCCAEVAHHSRHKMMVARVNPFAALSPAVVLLATAVRQVQASVSSRDVSGDACLPLDIITLLKSETCDAVAFACRPEIQDGASCSSECYDALQQFRSAQCYEYFSQSQHLQPRFQSNTLVALQGVWFGVYPASGIELVELRYDASKGMLTGTKLTGNQYVRAGRVSWEVTQTTCRVVSSLWAGVYTPRWDPCRLTIADSDHMSVTLSLGEGEEEVLNFVRAKLPLLLDWEDPNSPAYGFSDAMRRCNLPMEEPGSSVLSELWEALHHSKHTVLLDQGLLLFPLVLLGGYQMGAHSSFAVAGAAMYCVLLCVRLKYTGLLP